MMSGNSCLILGGSSQIGSWLAPVLVAEGWTVHLVSRGKKERVDYGPTASWHNFDLRNHGERFPAIDAKIAIDTLGNVDEWIEQMPGVSRVITFSSTSVFTKAESDDASDRKSTEAIRRREQSFKDACARAGASGSIIRPTLIYGGKRGDRTVTDIRKVIETFGFFPVFGAARGRRQPVHAEDLANACFSMATNPKTQGRDYNLGGGEVLPYRVMVERIFATMDRKPRFVSIPLPLFQVAAKIIRLLPRYGHITASMATRMQQDMIFSNEKAFEDFGYSPREFSP